MIMRSWKANTDPARALAYETHFCTNVLPELDTLGGSRGAYLLKTVVDGRAELLVLSIWDSIEAVKAFSGNDVDRAVVDALAMAALDTWDGRVQHYEILHAPGETAHG